MTSLITEQRDRMNLATVKRFDPYIQKILFTSQESCLYEYREDAWSKMNTEGVFFVYQRRADPRFGFIILNRHNSTNLLEPVTSEFDFKFEGNFLLYKNKDSKVHGIWFVEEGSCRAVYDLTQKLIAEQEKDKKMACATVAAESGEEEVKGIGGLANLLSKAALKNSNSSGGGAAANSASKSASNGGNRNSGTVKNPPSASKLMDLLSNAEDKEKEKKQKGSHNQSQKSQQQKQKQQGAAGSKKEERREVVEDIIVPQKAYLLGKEKSKKQHSKMADGKGEAGAATADKLGNVAAFFAKASEGGPTANQQQQPPVPMMPTGGIMPPNNASAPMAMPTPLMATGISMMTSGMSSLIPLEAASSAEGGADSSGNRNPNPLQRLMSNPGVNSLENLERLQRMKSVSPTLASQAVNLSELEEKLTAPSAPHPQATQGTMSYASAAAAPAAPPSHQQPPPAVKSNNPLQAVKDTDLTSGGRLGSPAKDGGGGEMGNNKQGKKLISPAALERTTPNTAKHQGENSPLVQTMFPPASALPLPPMPLTAPRESQVLEQQQQQQQLQHLNNGQLHQQPPPPSHQPGDLQLKQQMMLQQQNKMLALQQQQLHQLSYPQQQLVLNREQFVDTYHFLLNNDSDFVDKLHLAYLTRVQTMQHPPPAPVPIVLPPPTQNLQ